MKAHLKSIITRSWIGTKFLIKIFFLTILLLPALTGWAQQDLGSANRNNLFAYYNSGDYNKSVLYPRTLIQDNIQSKILYNGHNYDYYYKKYRNAKAIRTTGIVLSVVGTVTGVTGLIVGAFDAGDFDGNIKSSTQILVVGGGILLNVGIPLWVAGGIIRNNNKSAMEKGWPDKTSSANVLSLGISNNGLGLVYSF